MCNILYLIFKQVCETQIDHVLYFRFRTWIHQNVFSFEVAKIVG